MLGDPAPTVRAQGVIGEFVVVRVFVWHRPPIASEVADVDEAVRAVVAACDDQGIALEGPVVMALDNPRAAG